MMANAEHFLRDTNRRFSEKHISVDQDWIQECIEYFLSENSQISSENLFKSALEQWLLSDLADTGVKCLPEPVLSNKNEFVLNGKYVLQMQYLIDIAESAYEQWRNLYNRQWDEAEDEPEQRRQNVSKKKRMLKLELTDGHGSVIAMERSPITCLNTKLLPGTKLLIKGPMRCVNKVLFLEPKNVKILGGEVEKFSIENAYENVLLKALNRPITLTPKLGYEESNVVEQNRLEPHPLPIASANLPTLNDIIHDDDDDLFSNLDLSISVLNYKTQFNTNVVPSHSTHENMDKFLVDDDDEIFLDTDIPPDNITVPETSNRNQKPFTIVSDDDDSFDMTEIENEMLETENEELRNAMNNNAKHTSHMPSVTQSVKENIEYYEADLDEIFRSNYSIDSKTFSNDITDSNYEFMILGCPLVTILQLHSIDDNDKSERSFIVKCEIASIIDQLKIVSNKYRLVALITDSTKYQLEVTFSNDIVAKWGDDTTAEEFLKMKAVISKYPQQRQQLQNILDIIKTAATDLNGFVKIEYSNKNERPIVAEIIESQSSYEEMLKKILAKDV